MEVVKKKLVAPILPISVTFWPDAPFKYKVLALLARVLYWGFKMSFEARKDPRYLGKGHAGPVEYIIRVFRAHSRIDYKDHGFVSIAFDVETAYEAVFEYLYDWDSWKYYMIRREDVKAQVNFFERHRIDK